MEEILIKILNYLLKHILALIALSLSLIAYFKVNRVSIQLMMEPSIIIKAPFDFDGANLSLCIDNIGKTHIKDLWIAWATFTHHPKEPLRLAGKSPVTPRLKAKKKIQYSLEVREEINKLKNTEGNVFYLGAKAVYRREVDMKPGQNTYYFMLSHHSYGNFTEDITVWKQLNYIDIKNKLAKAMIL